MKYQWDVKEWNSGWGGGGQKVEGVRVTLPVFLERLEDEGWEIFNIDGQEKSRDCDVYVRRPR